MRFIFSNSTTISMALGLLLFGTPPMTTSGWSIMQPHPSLSTQPLQGEHGISSFSKLLCADVTKEKDELPIIGLEDGSGWACEQGLCEGQPPKKVRLKLPSSWKDLIPLHATRDEVERVLGAPNGSAGSRQIYENDTERVDVLYSTGRCEAVAGRWNVAPGVAILVDVYPNKSLFLDDIIFDKRKYVRQKWAHPEDWVTYRNKEDGIEIDTINYGKHVEEVRRFSFGPRAKDSSLRCNGEGAQSP